MAESYARGFGVPLVVCDHFYFNYGTILMESPSEIKSWGPAMCVFFQEGPIVLNVAVTNLTITVKDLTQLVTTLNQ
jgi:hypothetical protein